MEMKYRLLQHNQSGQVYAIREDRLATGPLQDNDYRDVDTPDATIQVAWGSEQAYAPPRPALWDNDDYIVLATDRDPLSALVDQPQALEPQ